ncbi:hypothetical protein BD769DRAFT_826604 [Suillus cothurnatus]|nr:hypothetical protein BD769DRAFT_826604 [Suillus cothurnatus]
MSSPPKDNIAPRPPSKVVEPTKVNTAPQQASTSPGDGAHIPADQIRDPSEVDRNDPNINVVEIPAEKKPPPSFKQQVFGECLSYNSDIRTHAPVGYAKVIRGKGLGNTATTEQGERLLRGEETIPTKRRGSTSD